MKRTRTVAVVASVLVGIALAPLTAWAEPKEETAQEKITRLKREGAELRMQLSAARMSSARAKTDKADALGRARKADEAQAALEKQIADLKTTVKMLTAQNAQLQDLVKADAARSADTKVRDALTQLVEALKRATALQAANAQFADEGKTLKAQAEQMKKTTAASRRELAIATATLRDVRQELAIEKGKRIAGAGPVNTTNPPNTGVVAKPKPKPIPKPKPKPVPEPKIATTVRAVSGDLASIGIGSTSGVREGMKLLITRGADYVATLVITEVEKRQAAGALVDIKLPARSGDTVSNMP